jgi:hypothetical protein
MKYLINRETKEHRIAGDDWQNTDTDHWRIVQADSEGWIEHTGAVCPLPDDCMTYIREDKHQLAWESAKKAGFWTWSYVTHYKPILEQAEPVQEPDYIGADLVVTRDGVECADQKAALLEFKMQCLKSREQEKDQLMKKVEAAKEPSAEAVADAVAKRILDQVDQDMLISRLKAAHEAAQTIPDLEAELREVLADMGYDLVARNPFTDDCCNQPEQCWEPCGELGKDERYVGVVEPEAEVETPQDLSDWRNWRKGDKIQCTEDSPARTYLAGCVYTIKKVDKRQKVVFTRTDNRGITGGWGADRFRFHSRPKGE